MGWINNFRISSKLILGFSILMILIVFLGTFSIWQLNEVNKTATEMEQDWMPSSVKLSNMATDIAKYRIGEFQYIVSATPEEKNRYETEMKDATTAYEKDDDAFRKLISKEEESLYEDVKRLYNSYISEHGNIIKVANEGKLDEAKALLRGKSQTSFDDLNKKLEALIKVNKDGAATASDSGNKTFGNSRFLIIVTMLLSLVLAIIISFVIASMISNPLKEAVQLADRLSEGDLSTSIERNSKDETGQLINAMNRMMVYLKSMAQAANEISSGNLSNTIEPKSPRDLFGNAFKNMTINLRNMANVADSISSGNLSVKADPQSAQDAFGNAFKKMLDNLRNMAAVADQISDGNLSTQLTPQSAQDAFGNAFKKMLDSLRGIVREIAEGAQSLSSAANELVATSSQQTNTITEQASSIQEITTTLDEIRAIVEQANERAKAVVDVSEQSLDISLSGQKELDQVVDAMGKIKYQVEAIAQNILDLSEKTIQIGEITSSVNDIAEQSNLLAVNAAIEATKAGEAGKGFGVVAVEVKNLAARSKKATTQVRSILAEIQKAANSTVMVTEEGSKRVESGVGQVYRIGTNIKSLHEVIVESSTAARQISSATNQQVTGIEQISIAMRQISQGTNDTVAGAKQQRVTAQNLSTLAGNLNNIVQRYRL